LVLSNPTPEITDGYEIQPHHALGHDPMRISNDRSLRLGGSDAGFVKNCFKLWENGVELSATYPVAAPSVVTPTFE
jgi:hypothetical protein